MNVSKVQISLRKLDSEGIRRDGNNNPNIYYVWVSLYELAVKDIY